MRTVIYADVLIIVNLIVNYFLLRAVGALTGGGSGRLRLLAGAALGGLYSLVIFLDRIPAPLLVCLSLAVAALLVLTAFGWRERRLYFKRCAAFLLANAFFAGGMLAVSRMFAPRGLIWRNGITYLELDLRVLTLLSVVCYVVISLIARFLRSGTPAQTVWQITLTLDGETVEGKALLDTGNTLRDGFSARPVLIAEQAFAAPLLPDNGDCSGLRGFRLIPFASVGGDGVLPAFQADCVTLSNAGRVLMISQPLVAVTQHRVIAGGYAALFGPAFAEEGAVSNRRKGAKTNEGNHAHALAGADRAAEDAALCRRD